MSAPLAAIAPLTVLLIEDNPADADLISEALQDAADAADPHAAIVNLVHADRLQQGEERLASGGIDATLLDLSLPDSHGFETFQRVFARFPDIAIVVLSGLDDRELAARAVREGAQDYLVKGRVEGDVLARSIRYAIERKHAEAERNRLERQRADAASSLQARNEVLALISHDLKTPLTTIKGQAQLLARRIESGREIAPEELLERLRGIESKTAQMSELLDELLDVAQLEAGQPLELRRQTCDLVDLVRRIVVDYAHRSPIHHLRFESPEPEFAGLWDGPRLHRVLANLLDNAIKYSPGGGEVVVNLTRERDGGDEFAVLTVSDTGIGIPPADLPNVFKRFYRASNVANRILGTGIGLDGARQIVEQHGGAIHVTSDLGSGTTFTIRLPLSI